MPAERIHRAQRAPTPGWSVALFVICVVASGYVRLFVFRDQIISLTWGLPMLICLWYPSRRLLWTMGFTFVVLAGIKAQFLLPDSDRGSVESLFQWLMQIVNIGIIGGTVHVVLRFIDQLHERHAQLEKAHEELMAREEEISRQNSELQSQAEELASQNEELERQTEELQQQSEELQTQSEELQTTNRELEKRQALLHTLLESVRVTGGDRELLERVCSSLFELLDGSAAAACILEKENDALVLRAHCGPLVRAADRWPFEHSFAAIVMAEQRTGFIADLAKRPDLILPRSESRDFRSVMATPLRVRGVPAGVVKVFSLEPREWTKDDFRMIEWVSAQSTLILEVRQLHRELRATNLNLDRVVAERTKELQEIVNELEHFSYTITHDMRAPLRAMTGYADMLAERSNAWLDPECREFVRRISSSGTRMDRLITDALPAAHVGDYSPHDRNSGEGDLFVTKLITPLV